MRYIVIDLEHLSTEALTKLRELLHHEASTNQLDGNEVAAATLQESVTSIDNHQSGAEKA